MSYHPDHHNQARDVTFKPAGPGHQLRLVVPRLRPASHQHGRQQGPRHPAALQRVRGG